RDWSSDVCSSDLLVCGVITYVGVLESVGTIDFLSDLLTGGTSPLVAALAAAYIGGLISAFASTAGVLGASIPLAAPLLDGGVLPLLGTISAIGIASSVADVSPLSTNGARPVGCWGRTGGRWLRVCASGSFWGGPCRWSPWSRWSAGWCSWSCGRDGARPNLPVVRIPGRVLWFWGRVLRIPGRVL